MSSCASSPSPRCGSVGVFASSRLRADMDGQLIAAVRARRLLYDNVHPKYTDNNAKIAAWKRIGEELRASSTACKARWNNIRDNYRKSLMRRAAGRPAHAHSYKYTPMLRFMDKFFKSKDANELNGEAEEESIEYIEEDCGGDETSDHDHDQLTEEIHDTAEPIGYAPIKVENGDEEQQESLVGYEYFEKGDSVCSTPSFPVHRAATHAVDAFLAGLSPTLKALAPLHLSLAKAEIFAVVHKYEMKGLMEGGGWPKEANPLP